MFKKIFKISAFIVTVLSPKFVFSTDYSTATLKSKAFNDLSKISSVDDLMSRGINAMVMFMGSIALALVVYAGFLWMTAGGNESKIEKARTIMVWTMLGTVAIGASYAFVRFIVGIFG